MKKFLLDYISALLNDGCNSLKIFIRDLDQRSNSIDMYQENSLPPTTRNVNKYLISIGGVSRSNYDARASSCPGILLKLIQARVLILLTLGMNHKKS